MFDLNLISNCRTELMGGAILWIIFYHFGVGFIFPYGELGVDIFFFLSSYGLCYSLAKDSDVFNFFKKRLLRIVPTWWVLISIMAIRCCYMNDFYPHNISQGLLYYTGFGWWFRGFLPNEHCCWYEWYIPTLLVFYSLMPFLFKLKVRDLSAVFILSIILGLLLSLMEVEHSIHWAYHRIPVFLLGILFYRFQHYYVYKECVKSILFNLVFLIILILGVCFCVYFKHQDNLIINIALTRYSFMAALPSLLIICSWLILKLKISAILRWFGTITLELYLIHVVRWPLELSNILFFDRKVSIIFAFIACSSTAYIFHILIEKCLNKLNLL